MRATPNWETSPAEILFYFLYKPPIDPAQLQLMRAELTKLVDKIAWTDAYRWEMESKFVLSRARGHHRARLTRKA